MTELVIQNKNLLVSPEVEEIAVEGDANSQVVKFRMTSRYIDGVDLSKKKIKIGFVNVNNQSAYEDASLYEIDENSFTFKWVISSAVTVKAGSVNVWVEFWESNEQNQYVWKTKPAIVKIAASFTVLNNAKGSWHLFEKNFYNSNNNSIITQITDTDSPIYIDNRTILMPKLEDIVVRGDNRSQILSFVVPRFYENIDLSTKTIAIKYLNAEDQGDRSPAVNVVVDNDNITFGWLIDNKVTVKDGYVRFAIEFLGYDEKNEFFVWSTKPAQLYVSEGLEVDSKIEKPDPSWLQEWLIKESEILANEEARKEAENTRQTDFNNLMTNAIAATENANNAADRANRAAQDAEDVVAGTGIVMESQKGQPNGVASLDGSAKIFVEQLPNYDINVDVQSGTEITSLKSDDSVALYKIEGATKVTVTDSTKDISPDNPAIIENAKNFDIVACGKNLLPKVTSTFINGITVSAQDDGTIILNGTATAKSYIAYPMDVYLNGTYTLSTNNNFIDSNVAIKTERSDTSTIQYIKLDKQNAAVTSNLNSDRAVKFTIIIELGTVCNNYIIKPQLELNSNATEYEPYKSNKASIPYEIGKLSNGLADTVEYIGDNKVKIIQKLVTATINGEGLTIYMDNTGNDTIVFRFMPQIAAKPVVNYNDLETAIYCDKFKPRATTYTGDQEGVMINQEGYIFIRIKRSRLSELTVAGFKEWLTANPVTIIYERLNPAEFTIDMPPLKTYAGTTNISTTAAVKPMITAYFKTQLWHVINNKIDKSEVPVTSVNEKTGDVVLTAEDVGAETPTGAQAKADTALATAKQYTDQEVDEVSQVLKKTLLNEFYVTGHRGMLVNAPENTLTAFRYCYAYGIDGFECDVRQTSDGNFVIIHDETVDRTTNGTGTVADMTLEQIKSLDAGSWVHSDYADETIPTLEEMLDYAKGKFKIIYMELKSIPLASLQSLYDIVKNKGMLDVVSFHSYSSNYADVLRPLDPNIKLSLITEGNNFDTVFTKAKEIKAFEMAIYWNWLKNNKDKIKEVQDAGIRVYTWGTSTHTDIAEAINAGVNGINLDNPLIWIKGDK